MNIKETILAALRGDLDNDKGGRRPAKRTQAREAGASLILFLDSPPIREWVKHINDAADAKLLTEEDMIWLGHLQGTLSVIAGALPDVGAILAIRGNQSHRWDK